MLGKLAELKSDPQTALEHYRFASHYDENSDYLKMKQAEQLLGMGEVSSAQKLLSNIQLEDDPDYHLLSARISALEFDLDSSQRHMDMAIRIYENQDDFNKVRETTLMKVALLSDAQRYSEAIKTLKAYIGNNNNDEIAYYFLGKIHSIQNEGDKAISAYKKALQIRPQFTTAAKALGLQYELAGQTDKAVEAYQQALLSAGDDIQIRSKLANLYLTQENYRGALEHLYFLHNMEPTNTQTKLRIALIHFKLEDLDEAEAMFARLLNDESISKDRIYFYLGALHEQKEDQSRAIEWYNRIHVDSPYFVESRLQISYLLEELSQPQKAVGNLVEAISLKPYQRELYIALASLYEKQHELPEAIRVLDKATRLLQKDEGILFILGTFLDKAGDFEAGIQKMRKILEINPNHAHAMNHIGYVYAERKMNLKEAEELLIKAVQLEPQNAYIIDSLGWLYHQKNELKKAKEFLEKAHQIEPKEPVIAEHLADVYQKMGLHDLALRMYKKVVELSKQKDQPSESASETNKRVRGKIAALSSEEAL